MTPQFPSEISDLCHHVLKTLRKHSHRHFLLIHIWGKEVTSIVLNSMMFSVSIFNMKEYYFTEYIFFRIWFENYCWKLQPFGDGNGHHQFWNHFFLDEQGIVQILLCRQVYPLENSRLWSPLVSVTFCFLKIWKWLGF